MKRTKKPWLYFIAGCSLISVLVACDKDKDNNGGNAGNLYTLTGTASASQEVPALSTTTFPGTGTVSGTYDPGSNMLSYSVDWRNLSGTATMGHFHGPALSGATAPPVVTFTLNNSGTTGTATGTATLTEAQEADLIAGKWYMNIHTTANGNGEIRAQVAATR